MHKVNKKAAPNAFLLRFQKPSHFMQLDPQNWTTYNQHTLIKRVNTQFQLEDHISGITFLTRLETNHYYA